MPIEGNIRTGKVVILDSSFCIFQATIALMKFGVYSSSLIKKYRYWPKYINGAECQAHFKDKQVGYQDALPGKIENIDFRIVW